MSANIRKIKEQLGIDTDGISPLVVEIMSTYASDIAAAGVARQINQMFGNKPFKKPGYSAKELRDANQELRMGFHARDIIWGLAWFCRGLQLNYENNGSNPEFEAQGRLDGIDYETKGFLLSSQLVLPDGRKADIQSFAYSRYNDTIYFNPATLATMIIEGRIGKEDTIDDPACKLPAFMHLAVGGAEESHHAWQRKNLAIWAEITRQALEGKYVAQRLSGSHIQNPSNPMHHMINICEDMTHEYIEKVLLPVIMSLKDNIMLGRNK